MEKVNVLFVCLGNICRSPMAEGLFCELVKKSGLSDRISCDSAGTGGWHAGSSPDARMHKTALQRGIELNHEARQLHADDFYRFDYILAMDKNNYRDITRICPPDAKSKVLLMRHFDAQDRDAGVPDPYYGGDKGFDEVFDIA